MAEDPRPDFEPWWQVCDARDCKGARMANSHCLAHTTDLSSLKPGDDLDLRGVAIGSARLTKILNRFMDLQTKRYVFGEVHCVYTWFSGRAEFRNAEFRGQALFYGAQFANLARFDGATCAGEMSFMDAGFHGDVVLKQLAAGGLDLRRTWFASLVEIEAMRSV